MCCPVQGAACQILLDGMQDDLLPIMSSVVRKLEASERRGRAMDGQNVSLKKYVGDLQKEGRDLKNEVGELKNEVGGLKIEVGELRKQVGDSMDVLDDMSLIKAVEEVEMGGDRNRQMEKNEMGVGELKMKWTREIGMRERK